MSLGADPHCLRRSPGAAAKALAERYGRLMPLGPMRDGGSRHRQAWCRCDCGAQRWVYVANLFSGRSRSCGCWQQEVAARLIRRAREAKRRPAAAGRPGEARG